MATDPPPPPGDLELVRPLLLSTLSAAVAPFILTAAYARASSLQASMSPLAALLTSVAWAAAAAAVQVALRRYDAAAAAVAAPPPPPSPSLPVAGRDARAGRGPGRRPGRARAAARRPARNPARALLVEVTALAAAYTTSVVGIVAAAEAARATSASRVGGEWWLFGWIALAAGAKCLLDAAPARRA